MKGVHDNLDIIPVINRPTNPSEIIGSSQFREFLDACRRKYSLVIIIPHLCWVWLTHR